MKLFAFVLPFRRSRLVRSGSLPSVVSGTSQVLMNKFLLLILLLTTATMACAQICVQFYLDSNHAIYFTPDPARMLAVDATASSCGLLIAGQGLYTGNYLGQPGSIAALPSHQTFTAALYGGPSASSMTLQATTGIGNVDGEGNIIGRSICDYSSLWRSTWTWDVQVFSGITTPALGTAFGSGGAAAVAWASGGYGGDSGTFTCEFCGDWVSLTDPTPCSSGGSGSTWATGTYSLTDWPISAGGPWGAIEVSAAPTIGSPRILAQPGSAVGYLVQSVTFTVAVSGNTPLSYQWQFNGTNLSDGGNVSGSATNTLTLSTTTLADAGSYRIIITNDHGSVTSAVAMLQVVPFGAPSIRVNNQLAVGTVPSVGSAQLTVSGGFTNGFIFYTLDGSIPTTSSPLYAGPITLTNSATIQAMSLSADFSQSAHAPAVEVQIIPVYNLQTSVVGSGTISVNPTNGPLRQQHGGSFDS